MPVLIDPEQHFAGAFRQPRHHVHVVLGRGAEILYSEYYPDDADVIAAIDAAIAR